MTNFIIEANALEIRSLETITSENRDRIEIKVNNFIQAKIKA